MPQVGLIGDLRSLNVNGLNDNLVREQRAGLEGERGGADTNSRGGLKALGIAYHQPLEAARPGKQ